MNTGNEGVLATKESFTNHWYDTFLLLFNIAEIRVLFNTNGSHPCKAEVLNAAMASGFTVMLITEVALPAHPLAEGVTDI